MNADLSYIKKYYPDMVVIADCGAYQSKRNANHYYQKTPRGYAEFCSGRKFDLIIEMDFLSDNMLDDIFNVIDLNDQFYENFSTEDRPTFVRALHGRDLNEVVEYYRILKEKIPIPIDYYALSNMGDNLMKEVLKFLNSEGIKRIHILGQMNSKTLKILKECDALYDFETISFDSSSIHYYSVKMKSFNFLNKNGRDVNKNSFSKKTEPDIVLKSVEIANNCDCPICNKIIFNGEMNTLKKLGFYGKEMYDGNGWASSVFDKKCYLHNIYQQQILIDKIFSP